MEGGGNSQPIYPPAYPEDPSREGKRNEWKCATMNREAQVCKGGLGYATYESRPSTGRLLSLKDGLSSLKDGLSSLKDGCR